MKRVNTRGLQQANKCMIMAAVAYNLKKLLKFTTYKSVSIAKAMQIRAEKSLLKLVLDLYLLLMIIAGKVLTRSKT
jgi:hypothetical protein